MLMLISQVHITVKPDCIDAFLKASTINATASLNEPGIERFDIIQLEQDKTKFIFVEAYQSEADQLQHKHTDHFKQWVIEVENMMAHITAT